MYGRLPIHGVETADSTLRKLTRLAFTTQRKPHSAKWKIKSKETSKDYINESYRIIHFPRRERREGVWDG